MANTIHLIRHGAVQAPSERRYIGSTDLALTDLGKEQAGFLRIALQGIAFDAVFVSPLVRAQQTAQLAIPESADITHAPRQSPETVDDLREVDFGDWEGLTFDEIQQRDPDLVSAWATGNTDITFPGGESASLFRERVCRCGTDLASRKGLDTIAIVAHAGVVQTLICHYLNVPLEDHWRFTIDHASLTTVQLAGSFGSLRRLNFTPSLD